MPNYIHITDASYEQIMDSNNTLYEYGKCVHCDNKTAVLVIRPDDKKCDRCGTLTL